MGKKSGANRKRKSKTKQEQFVSQEDDTTNLNDDVDQSTQVSEEEKKDVEPDAESNVDATVSNVNSEEGNVTVVEEQAVEPSASTENVVEIETKVDIASPEVTTESPQSSETQPDESVRSDVAEHTATTTEQDVSEATVSPLSVDESEAATSGTQEENTSIDESSPSVPLETQPELQHELVAEQEASQTQEEIVAVEVESTEHDKPAPSVNDAEDSNEQPTEPESDVKPQEQTAAEIVIEQQQPTSEASTPAEQKPHSGSDAGTSLLAPMSDVDLEAKAESTDDDNQNAVFFHPKTWSSRFGAKFYTATVESAELEAEDCFFPTAYYVIHVSCGKDSWTVRRRYSEFHTLMQTMTTAFPQLQGSFTSALPPKTAFGIKFGGEEFVENRRTALQEFLAESLKQESVGQLPAVRNFLLLDSKGN